MTAPLSLSEILVAGLALSAVLIGLALICNEWRAERREKSEQAAAYARRRTRRNRDPHWLGAGAHKAPRSDQGNGVEAATAAPSQSVEKVAPAATTEGDGPMSAAGPVAVMATGSNSPERASKLGSGQSGGEPERPAAHPSPGTGRESPGTLSRFGASALELGRHGNEPVAPLRGPRPPGAGQESPALFTLIAGGR